MKELIAMLGFAARAGQIAIGSEQAVALIRSGKAAAAVLDAGASENTAKRLSDACAYRSVPLKTLDQGALGRAIGKEGCAAAALKKGGCAERILILFSQQTDQPAEQ